MYYSREVHTFVDTFACPKRTFFFSFNFRASLKESRIRRKIDKKKKEGRPRRAKGIINKRNDTHNTRKELELSKR